MSGFGVEHLPYGAILPLGGWTAEDAAVARVAEHLGGKPVLSTRLGGDAVLLPILVGAGLLGEDPDLQAALLAAFAPGKSLTGLSAMSFLRGQAGTTADDGVFWLTDEANGDKPVGLGGSARRRSSRR